MKLPSWISRLFRRRPSVKVVPMPSGPQARRERIPRYFV